MATEPVLGIGRRGGDREGPGRLRRFAAGAQPLYFLAQLLLAPLPPDVGLRFRTRVYRAIGFGGIDPTVELQGRLQLRGRGDLTSRLSIGRCSGVNTPFFADLFAPVTIGERVGIGHHLVISTSGHDTGDPRVRSGRINSAPVTIEDGAWIGARVTILSGVVVGHGAVVCAGAVVAKDVPPDAKVAGNPARVVGWLPGAVHPMAAPAEIDGGARAR